MSDSTLPAVQDDKQIDTDDLAERLRVAGQVANQYAASAAFTDERSKKSKHTLRAHDRDLASFAGMLNTLNTYRYDVLNRGEDGQYPEIAGDDPTRYLNVQPQAWQGITFGLVKMYRNYLLDAGYAISTINRRLSTLRRYAGLALEAGVLSSEDYARIKQISGYSGKEARNIDEDRAETRIIDESGQAIKKAENVRIGADMVSRLKQEHDLDTPIGRRNRALMALLLDHGLRAGEAADLRVGDINLDEGTMTFYRQKVNKTQTHILTTDSLSALSDYIKQDAALQAEAPLLLTAKRNGKLKANRISTRSITRIVNELGNILGIERLSAHDCRHSWATRAAKGGTSPFALQEAGGWNSLAMPRRYVDEQNVANEGVILSN